MIYVLVVSFYIFVFNTDMKFSFEFCEKPIFIKQLNLVIMRKIFILLFLMILGSSAMYAGTWVIGTNQVDRFLKAIEQGTGDVPPTAPLNTGGAINTDYVGVWDIFPGITCTSQDVLGVTYQDYSDANNHWRGLVSINYANKGYKQKAGTEIAFVQPSTVDFDYTSVPVGYTTLKEYYDKNDLSWLETIDLSGNNFNNIVIDAGLYNAMPLKNVNLSNNPNLTTLSIVNCTGLVEVNLSGTGLSTEAFNLVKADILASSPTANIIHNATGVASLAGAVVPKVKVMGNNIRIENKNANDVVNIFSVSGQKLLETTEESINTGLFGKGIYIVKINSFITKIRI